MPEKAPSVLNMFGWRKFFGWLNMRFARKQDRLRAGPGIQISGTTISTAIPSVTVKMSEMFELIRSHAWQANTLYFCVDDNDPRKWCLFFNGGDLCLHPTAWREYLDGDAE